MLGTPELRTDLFIRLVDIFHQFPNCKPIFLWTDPNCYYYYYYAWYFYHEIRRHEIQTDFTVLQIGITKWLPWPSLSQRMLQSEKISMFKTYTNFLTFLLFKKKKFVLTKRSNDKKYLYLQFENDRRLFTSA